MSFAFPPWGRGCGEGGCAELGGVDCFAALAMTVGVGAYAVIARSGATRRSMGPCGARTCGLLRFARNDGEGARHREERSDAAIHASEPRTDVWIASLRSQ